MLGVHTHPGVPSFAGHCLRERPIQRLAASRPTKSASQILCARPPHCTSCSLRRSPRHLRWYCAGRLKALQRDIQDFSGPEIPNGDSEGFKKPGPLPTQVVATCRQPNVKTQDP